MVRSSRACHIPARLTSQVVGKSNHAAGVHMSATGTISATTFLMTGSGLRSASNCRTRSRARWRWWRTRSACRRRQFGTSARRPRSASTPTRCSRSGWGWTTRPSPACTNATCCSAAGQGARERERGLPRLGYTPAPGAEGRLPAQEALTLVRRRHIDPAAH